MGSILCSIFFLFFLFADGLPSPGRAGMTISLALATEQNLEDTQGWTSSPNTRGSIDIIWSCFITIFLCGWTSIYVNVPPLGAGKLKQFERKFMVFLEALAGPEFIFHTAISQYISARRSVKEFEEPGYQGWTTRHGFFADMGGFVLDPPDFVPFPLTVSQLHYLVCHGYVDYTAVHLSHAEINDRNKLDGISRLITSAQLFWSVLNITARWITGLSITTLEISTLGFVFCSLCTYVVWREKPSSVTQPMRLIPKAPMTEILIKAGPGASEPYRDTPMDFAKRNPHWFGVIWHYCVQWPAKFGVPFHPLKRPIDKVWDDEFGELGVLGNFALMIVQLGFSGIHIAAWNFHFPTRTEAFLWHLTSVYIMASMVATWALLSYSFELHPKLVDCWRRRKSGSEATDKRSSSATSTATGYRRPPAVAMTTIPLGILYMVARGYIILEDLINLRELPSSAYQSIDWSSVVPHF